MAHVRVNVDEDPCAADEDGDIDRLIREADDDILGRGVRQLHPNLHSAMVSRMQMGQRMLGGEEEDDDDDDEQRVGLIRMPRPAKKVAPALPSKALKRAPPMTPIGTPAMATVAVSKETRQKKKPKTEEPQPVVVKAVPPPSKSKAKEPKPQPLAAAVKRVAVVDEEKKEAVQEAGKKKRKVPTRAAKKTEPSKEKEETTLAVTTTMGMPPTPPPSSIQEAAAVPEITPAVIVPAVAEKKPMTQAQSIKLRLGKASTFPCEDDLDKCAEWVLLALYTTKLTGVYGGYYDPAKVGNHALHTTEASFLFYRHLYLRTQVAAAWQKLCDQSGNADMATIARLMPHCKMYIDPKPKVYCQDAVCVWSGEQTNLHPVALVPITEDNTMALRNWIKEPGTSAIQFHIGAAFKEVLKCVHTVLFLLDYVPFQIDAGKKKAEMHLKGEWCREMEMELEERVLRSKSGPLFAIRKSVRDVIVANMKAFRAIVGPEIATEFLVPFTGNQGCTIAQEATKKLAERSMQLNI